MLLIAATGFLAQTHSGRATAATAATACVIAPSVVFDVSPKVAYGPFNVFLDDSGAVDEGDASDDGPTRGTAVLTIKDALTGDVLSVQPLPKIGQSAGDNDNPISLETATPAHRALVLVLTYETTESENDPDDAAPCTQTISQPVTAFPGLPPRIRITKAPPTSGSPNVSAAGLLASPPSGGCALLAPGQLTIEISRGSVRRIFDLTPCYALEKFPAFPGLILRNESDLNFDSKELAVFPEHALPDTFKRRFHITATFRGKTLLSCRVTVSNSYAPGIRVYDGPATWQFDDYINICVNGAYTTYASGGRLYCFIPGTRQATTSITAP